MGHKSLLLGFVLSIALLTPLGFGQGGAFGAGVSNFIIEFEVPYNDTDIAQLEALGANVTAELKIIPALAATFSEDLIANIEALANVKRVHLDKILKIAQTTQTFEDFDDASDWIVANGALTPVTTPSPPVGSFAGAAQISASLEGTANAFQAEKAAVATQPDSISWYVNAPAFASGDIFFNMLDSNRGTVAIVRFNADGNVYVSDFSGGLLTYINAGPYAQGLWSLVSLQNIDWNAKTADLVVDLDTRAKGLTLLPGANISIFASQSPVNYFIDEIVLSFPAPIGPLPQPTTWNIPKIRAPEVWAEGVTGSGQTVCVIDTGVNSSHPALAGKVVAQVDRVNTDPVAEDDNGHGTHIAGIIASVDQNVPGVAPGASIAAIKACDAAGNCQTSDVIQSLELCTGIGRLFDFPPSPLPTIGILALGGLPPVPVGNCDFDILAQAANAAVERGLTVVAAAGNLGPLGITTPGCASKVITVGASDESDQVAAFSSRGDRLDIVAPGVNIRSLAHTTSSFTDMSGTSQASAHVAGAAALLFEAYTSVSPAAAKKSLKDTAVLLGRDESRVQGDGRLDAYKAYRHYTFQELTTPPKVDVVAPSIVFLGESFTSEVSVRNPGSSSIPTASVTLQREPIEAALLEGAVNPLPQTMLIGEISPRIDSIVPFTLQAERPGVVRLSAKLLSDTTTVTLSRPSERIFILPAPRSFFDAIVDFFRNIFNPPRERPVELQSAQLALSQAVAALRINDTAAFVGALTDYERALNATADAIAVARVAGQNVTPVVENATSVVQTNVQLLVALLPNATNATVDAIFSAINSANGFIQSVQAAPPTFGLDAVISAVNRSAMAEPTLQAIAHQIEDLVLSGTPRIPPPDRATVGLTLSIIRNVKAELFAQAERFIENINVTKMRQRLAENILQARTASTLTVEETNRLLNLSVNNIRDELLNMTRSSSELILQEVNKAINASRSVSPDQLPVLHELALQIELIDRAELERAINETNLTAVVKELARNVSAGAPPEITDALIRDILLKLLQVFKALEDFKLGIVESFLDFTPPTPIGLQVTPDPVGPGKPVTIRFTVNESLIQDPIVFVQALSTALPAAFLSSSGGVCAAPPSQFLSAQDWAFTHRVAPDKDLVQLRSDLDSIDSSFNVGQFGIPDKTKYVRITMHWDKVEPSRGVFDTTALAFYKSYIQDVRDKGFEPIVILGAPTLGPDTQNLEGFLGTPLWALEVLVGVPVNIPLPPRPIPFETLSSASVAAFVDEFGAYVNRVAQEVGSLVDIYQVWNEPNAGYALLPDPVDVQLFQRAKQELNLVDPGSETLVNVGEFGKTQPFNTDWRAALGFYLSNAASAIDIIALDFYPGSPGILLGMSPRDWDLLEDLFYIGGVTGKKVAVMETGFPTPEKVPFHFDPHGQQNWISYALPAMLTKIGELSSGAIIPQQPPDFQLPVLGTYSVPPFLFAAWYEYYDRDSADNVNPESRFGIVNTDRSAKPGIDDMRYYMNVPRPAGTSTISTTAPTCEYVYTFTIPSAIPRGEHQAVAFASAIDTAQAGLVGNEGNATIDFLIDALPPGIENITITPFYASKVNVSISFDVNESVLGEPSVIVRDAFGVNRTAALISSSPTGQNSPLGHPTFNFIYRYEVTDEDAEGTATVFIAATDLAENVGSASSSFVIDKTPPVTTASVSGIPEPEPFTDFFIDNATVTLSAVDALSPVVATLHCVDQSNTCVPTINDTSVTVDTKGTNFVRFFSIDAAENAEAVKSVTVNIDKDTDGDGVMDNFDVCPAEVGSAERQGCNIADFNTVDLHIIDQAKSGACPGGAGSCKSPLAGVEVRVFDRNDADFQALWTKNPRGTQYADVYETGVGWIGSATPLYQRTGSSCVTDSSGVCITGEQASGDFLVITKYTDPQTLSIIYNGRPKSPSDFADTDRDTIGDLATKEFQVIKVIKRDGTIDFKGGSKTVVLGSMLEIIYPSYAIWVNSNETYPFIFVSDSNWSVDICLQVPQGYSIFGIYDIDGNLMADANCTQAFVAGETKVALFELVEVSSPEPDVTAMITTTSPTGELTTLALDIPGQRIRAAVAFPFIELLLGLAAGAGLTVAAVLARRRRRSYAQEYPETSESITPQLFESDTGAEGQYQAHKAWDEYENHER